MKNNRLFFLLAFILLVLAEILIARYAHGNFLRSYVGDMLVVIVLYCFIRCFVPERFPWLPFGVFAFAVLIEILQGINITELLGIENQSLKTAIGTTFDIWDIASYAAGCCLLGIYEILSRKITKTEGRR